MKPNNPLTISFLEKHPVDAARALERMPGQAAGDAVAGVGRHLAASVMEKTLPQAAARILRHTEDKNAAEIVEEMETVAASRVIAAFGAEKAGSILKAMSGARRKAIRKFTAFPAGSAGALMETNPAVFRRSSTVKEAVSALKRKKSRTTGGIYVVDDEFRLAGALPAITLIKAESQRTLDTLVDQGSPSVSAWTTLSALASHPGWERRRFLPVVERREVLVGEVHYWRVAEAMARQASTSPGDPFGSLLEAAAISWAAGAELLGLSFAPGDNRRQGSKKE